ncbi:saccharopine dehydrogenase-like oxidoreductase [Ostrinia furnacalis]|uniref:saccharopine dehydrogenase-like oxidoreductase n=1 Tax=Ostrinia furnacalis TaxID=93504 RepID=UPI00103D61C8|nr:saccharopine dehydrogenase-like oxidoreductase [Ostrinia furnacalis]
MVLLYPFVPVSTVNDEPSVAASCVVYWALITERVPALSFYNLYRDILLCFQFMGTMQIKYDNEARQAGIYVISACGFDSIPNDMGVIFLEKNFQGTLHSVESYLSLSTVKEYQKEARKSGVLNFGTWESLVYVFANFTEILKLRSKLYPKNESTYKPKLKQRYIHKQNGKWAVPLVSPDGSIVKRTQHRLLETNNKRPVQFQPYIVLPSISYVFLLGIITMFVGILSKFKYGRALLLNKPEWFSLGLVSKQGPTQTVMDNTCFTFEMFGRGWDMGQDTEASEPKKTVIAKVSAMDPAYGFTSLALVQSAIAILKEKHKMPSTGGVFTSGAAFWKTSLVAKLQENNVKFEIFY